MLLESGKESKDYLTKDFPSNSSVCAFFLDSQGFYHFLLYRRFSFHKNPPPISLETDGNQRKLPSSPRASTPPGYFVLPPLRICNHPSAAPSTAVLSGLQIRNFSAHCHF